MLQFLPSKTRGGTGFGGSLYILPQISLHM